MTQWGLKVTLIFLSLAHLGCGGGFEKNSIPNRETQSSTTSEISSENLVDLAIPEAETSREVKNENPQENGKALEFCREFKWGSPIDFMAKLPFESEGDVPLSFTVIKVEGEELFRLKDYSQKQFVVGNQINGIVNGTTGDLDLKIPIDLDYMILNRYTVLLAPTGSNGIPAALQNIQLKVIVEPRNDDIISAQDIRFETNDGQSNGKVGLLSFDQTLSLTQYNALNGLVSIDQLPKLDSFVLSNSSPGFGIYSYKVENGYVLYRAISNNSDGSVSFISDPFTEPFQQITSTNSNAVGIKAGGEEIFYIAPVYEDDTEPRYDLAVSSLPSPVGPIKKIMNAFFDYSQVVVQTANGKIYSLNLQLEGRNQLGRPRFKTLVGIEIGEEILPQHDIISMAGHNGKVRYFASKSTLYVFSGENFLGSWDFPGRTASIVKISTPRVNILEVHFDDYHVEFFSSSEFYNFLQERDVVESFPPPENPRYYRGTLPVLTYWEYDPKTKSVRRYLRD